MFKVELGKIKPLESWVTITDASKLMDVTRTYVWMLVYTGKINKLRRAGAVVLINKKEAMKFKRKTPRREQKTEVVKGT